MSRSGCAVVLAILAVLVSVAALVINALNAAGTFR